MKTNFHIVEKTYNRAMFILTLMENYILLGIHFRRKKIWLQSKKNMFMDPVEDTLEKRSLLLSANNPK